MNNNQNQKDLQKAFEKASKREVNILLIGRTGVGKSSMINSLLGKEVAPVGHYEPETVTTINYPAVISGIKFNIYDTPGLCDEEANKGKDEEHLKNIMQNVNDIDIMFYVTPLNETRVRGDEKRAIRLVSELSATALRGSKGKDIWTLGIIVFTFSKEIDIDDDLDKVKFHRSRVIKKEISKNIEPSISNNIPTVLVDNYAVKLKNGVDWLPILWTQTAQRISSNGFIPFLISQSERTRPFDEVREKKLRYERELSYEDRIEHKTQSYDREIVLNREQVNTVHQRIIHELGPVATITGTATAGAVIGSLLGPVGTAVGGAIGAGIGALKVFFGRK